MSGLQKYAVIVADDGGISIIRTDGGRFYDVDEVDAETAVLKADNTRLQNNFIELECRYEATIPRLESRLAEAEALLRLAKPYTLLENQLYREIKAFLNPQTPIKGASNSIPSLPEGYVQPVNEQEKGTDNGK